MKISDILSLDPADLAQMDDSFIRDAANALVSAANKRLRRLFADDVTSQSPALESFRDDDTGIQSVRFSTRGKDREALISEINTAAHFMELKTSTKKGAKEWYDEMIDRITGDEEVIEIKKDEASKTIDDLTADDLSDFWSAYHEWRGGSKFRNSVKSEVLQQIAFRVWSMDGNDEALKDRTKKELFEEEARRAYEENKEFRKM